MRTKSLGVLVAVVLVVGACGAATQPSASQAPAFPSVSPPPAASADTVGGASPAPSPTAATSDAPSGATMEVTVGTDTDAELKFDPGEVTVRAGAHIRLTFENRAAVPHNLTLQTPINVATSTVVDPGSSDVVEFKAPDPGRYPFVCTLHPGMAGTLVAS